MTEERAKKKVAIFRPRPADLEATIRKAALAKASPGFSKHALVRMDQRGITTLDVLRVLKVGSIRGEIEAGKGAGEWKCKVIAQIGGNRDAGVVTIVTCRGKLFIKTVEWEDL